MNKSMKTLGCMTVILLSMSLAACSGQTADSGTNAQNGGTNGNQVQDQNGGRTDVQDKPSETKQGTGIFIGLIDNHSAEIELEGTPTAFQMDETLAALAQSLAQGTPVAFDYVEQAVEGDDLLKQLVLTKLEASEGKAVTDIGVEEASGLPAEKAIEVELEGMKEQRTAKLAQGAGYAFYMFDGFSFDAGAHRLTMDYDPGYHVDISKLPAGYDVADLAKTAREELSKTGKVEERSGEEIYVTMRDAELYLIASGDDLTREYIVKNIGGQGYAWMINMPHGEASEGFGPLAFASLNTIVATD
ncbi:hypothetical protein [Paenibacillus macerans]|uniref:hypothetical protein n=1 Tax=Paenibacillus macerans TaxID=44252 RepID=UPI003D31986C